MLRDASMISIADLELNTAEILRTQLINSLGLSNYECIVKNLQTTDLTAIDDAAAKYRKTFNSFYRLRRNDIWRGVYYKFFQEIKRDTDIEFKDVMVGLQGRLKYEGINSLEPSFASKMLATINTDKPIWDSRVLAALKLDKEWEKKRSADHAIEIYESICDRYKEFESNESCDECVLNP